MDLQMDCALACNYTSNSQKTRVITEQWVSRNLYCPCCGHNQILHFENNRPVADFYCPKCSEEYELKSKNGVIENRVSDGAYATMVKRIESVNNPHFFFMNYNKTNLRVVDFLMVPKYFLAPGIIEKRPPLADTARRAGWVGCNILINRIPNEGKIYIVRNEVESPPEDVIAKVKKTEFIKQYRLDARGWILDVLNCVNQIEENSFSLEQVYRFENILAAKHPDNQHVREKIRQQLQVLRDKGIIEFQGRGYYRKVIM